MQKTAVLLASLSLGCASVQEQHPEAASPSHSVQEALSDSATKKAEPYCVFEDEDIRTVLEILAKEAGVNLIISADVQGTASFALQRPPTKETIENVAKASGYVLVRVDADSAEVYRVVHPSSLRRHESREQRATFKCTTTIRPFDAEGKGVAKPAYEDEPAKIFGGEVDPLGHALGGVSEGCMFRELADYERRKRALVEAIERNQRTALKRKQWSAGVGSLAHAAKTIAVNMARAANDARNMKMAHAASRAQCLRDRRTSPEANVVVEGGDLTKVVQVRSRRSRSSFANDDLHLEDLDQADVTHNP